MSSAPIFVSFASKDRKVAQTVCEALENRGFSCWMSSQDIGPGENFQVSIVRAIRAARVMILVFSENSNNSEEIKKELALASQSQLVVIPVRVEDVAPSEAFAYEFATRQWIDLFDDWEGSILRLVRQLTTIGIAAAGGLTRKEVSLAGDQARALSPAPIPAPTAAPASGSTSKPTSTQPLASAPLSVPVSVSAEAPKSTPLPVSNRPSATGPVSVSAPTAAPKAIPMPPLSAPISAVEAFANGVKAKDQKNYSEAMRWYRMAADQGYAGAQNNIGVLYKNGSGVAQDYSEAMRWYRMAADQGYAGAQFNIGLLYGNGSGVAQDYSEAMRWYRMAADQGYAGAQNNIGLLYDNGSGVAQDYSEAMRWYRMAADQGDAGAQNNIGALYADGQGVTYDLKQARSWMTKAAAGGSENAKNWLAAHPDLGGFVKKMLRFR